LNLFFETAFSKHKTFLKAQDFSKHRKMRSDNGILERFMTTHKNVPIWFISQNTMLQLFCIRVLGFFIFDMFLFVFSFNVNYILITSMWVFFDLAIYLFSLYINHPDNVICMIQRVEDIVVEKVEEEVEDIVEEEIEDITEEVEDNNKKVN